MTRGGFFRPRLVFSADHAGDLPAPERDNSARFRLTMLPHLDAAYNLARYLTRDPAAAEDIVQEAFLRAFRGFDGWRGDGAKSWLLAIVRNCFHDHVQAQTRNASAAMYPGRTSEDAFEAAEQQSPESLLAAKDEAAKVRATIEQLPEPFRETLILRELEELNYKEIAAIAQIPIGTVMSRLSRARQMLHDLLLPDAQREAQR